MILQAEEKHYPEVLFIYESCIPEMNARGLFNWNSAYPGRETVFRDIQDGNLYVYREFHTSLGVFCLNDEQPRQYEGLDWKLRGKFLVVHRLAVHPVARGKGIALKMMEHAEFLARERDCDIIRLDAITSNPQAMKLYETSGYQKTGLIHFEYQTIPFQCMEKNIQARKK